MWFQNDADWPTTGKPLIYFGSSELQTLKYHLETLANRKNEIVNNFIVIVLDVASK